MRNQNSKVRTTKRKLSKCEGVCISSFLCILMVYRYQR